MHFYIAIHGVLFNPRCQKSNSFNFSEWLTTPLRSQADIKLQHPAFYVMRWHQMWRFLMVYFTVFLRFLRIFFTVGVIPAFLFIIGFYIPISGSGKIYDFVKHFGFGDLTTRAIIFASTIIPTMIWFKFFKEDCELFNSENSKRTGGCGFLKCKKYATDYSVLSDLPNATHTYRCGKCGETMWSSGG